ncbi:MAG: SUMF1/EgtB/PvdO family nonheme iron enzyme [Phycisphaerales bacterium]|nr:SUMF1/EgtB/PvdO family nonheme iron enzyme [Phycisphaerales bacterium]
MLKRTLFAAALSLPLAAANAQPAPDYDFPWATISDPGNAAFQGSALPFASGRGSVGYTYRISTLQVTTGQWMEFVNTFSMQPGGEAFSNPTQWGAYSDPRYNGPGVRWIYGIGPDVDLLPVAGISWREGAMYCNWLHNNKAPEQWALETGAYDTSTFSTNQHSYNFTDQLTRSPDARFWIPSLDEWLKAAHYDPNRFGPGDSGWWQYPNSSDAPLQPGPPGEGQTTAGWVDPDPNRNLGEWYIPLGAYPDEASPWGLLDISGGATEWTEEHIDLRWRVVNGSSAGFAHAPLDWIEHIGAQLPDSRNYNGLRIASVVPAPSTGMLLVTTLAVVLRRRRIAS